MHRKVATVSSFDQRVEDLSVISNRIAKDCSSFATCSFSDSNVFTVSQGLANHDKHRTFTRG